LCVYILVNTIPRTQKYGLRITGYAIFPLIGYWVIKTRKKIKWDITDIFLIGFWISIYISSFNAMDKRSVISEFKDAGLIFLIPLFLKQLNYGKFFRKILARIAIITIAANIILGYFEKINLISGRYGGMRIAADTEVWRYAGLLMLGIVFFIHNVVQNEKKALNAYLLLLSGTIMLWTQNRANWVAILVVTILMLIVKNIKKGVIGSLLIVIALGIGLKLAPKDNPIVVRMSSITDTVTKYESGGGEQGRIELWKESVHMYMGSRITGIGYSPKNFGMNERTELYKYVPKHSHVHSHNSYFYILATMGIVGSFFFLGVNFSILYILFKEKNYLSYLGVYLFISWMVMGLFETP
ncbi:MAG: O-antigen ligase family protein, partial [Fusobacteriaceae bacterium]